MSPYTHPTSFLLSLPILPPPSPRTPFPVTYVNPRALLIAVALFVSSAGGLRPKRLAGIRPTGRYWRRVLVTVEVALLQSVQSCCIASSGCHGVPVGTPHCSPLLPRLCSGPHNKFYYSIGQGPVTVLAPRNLRWLVDFWNVCTPRYRVLFYTVPEDGNVFVQQSDIGLDIPWQLLMCGTRQERQFMYWNRALQYLSR